MPAQSTTTPAHRAPSRWWAVDAAPWQVLLAVALAVLALLTGLVVGLAPPATAEEDAQVPTSANVSLTVDPTAAAPGASAAVTMGLHGPDVAGSQATGMLTLPEGVTLTSADGPAGWVLEYSTDGGSDWSTDKPADFAGVTNVRVAGEFGKASATSVPLAPLDPVGALEVTGGGDGFGALFYQDQLWLVNHHARAVDKQEPGVLRRGGTWLKCFNRIDGTACPAPYPGADGTFISEVPGTAFGEGSSTLVTPNASVAAINAATGRLYAAVQVHAESGTTAVGWICGELATMTSCGFTRAGEEGAPEDLGGNNIFPKFNPAQPWTPDGVAGRLYAVGGSGTIYCFDVDTASLCSDNGGQAVAQPLSTTTQRFLFTTAVGESLTAPAARYVYSVSMPDETSGLLQCRDVTTGAGCTPGSDGMALPNPGGAGAPVTFGQPLPVYSPAGAFEGVCVFGQSMFTAGTWTCVDPAGGPLTSWQSAMAAVTPAESAHFGGRIEPYGEQGPFSEKSLMMYATILGTKLFIPWVQYPNSGVSLGATNSIACFDYLTGTACAGFVPPSAPYADNIVYTLNEPPNLPGCVWWSGNEGRLQAFSGTTGQLGCDPTSFTTMDVEPASCAPLDDATYGELTLPGLPAGASARVSLYDTKGALLPAGQDQVLTSETSLDLSAIPISGATSQLRAVVEATAAKSVDLAGAAVRITVAAPESLCVAVTPVATCEAGPELTLAAAATVVPVAGGSAIDSTTSAKLLVERDEDDCTLALVKTVNGELAPEAPGVTVGFGGEVAYRFAVSTPGTFTLGTPVVLDDATTADDPSDDFAPTYADGDTNSNGLLDPGETWTYAHETSAEAVGTFTNTATATAAGATNNPVTARAVYTTAQPGISVVKTTNAVAATAPGLELMADDDVTWAYEVTNTGPVTLVGIALVDDPAGSPTCATDTLVPGESMGCTLTGTTVAGTYENTVTATGTVTGTDEKVTDEDRNEYSGLDPRVSIVKTINGGGTAAADGTPNRIELAVDQPTDIAFEVTNTGSANLIDVVVTDEPLTAGDTALAVTCPAANLAVAETMICTGTGTAQAGEHDDRATVTATGTFSDGSPLTFADGAPVPPVGATSEAGYMATPTPEPSPSSPTPSSPPPTPGTPGEPGQPGAPGRPGQAGGAGSSGVQPVASGGKLAQTGANLLGFLAVGGAALGAGLGLYRIGRKRPS